MTPVGPSSTGSRCPKPWPRTPKPPPGQPAQPCSRQKVISTCDTGQRADGSAPCVSFSKEAPRGVAGFGELLRPPCPQPLLVTHRFLPKSPDVPLILAPPERVHQRGKEPLIVCPQGAHGPYSYTRVHLGPMDLLLPHSKHSFPGGPPGTPSPL